MRFDDRSIKNIRDLLQLLETDTNGIKTPLWFRGHAQINYQLIPSFYRYSKTLDETDLIEKFKQNATLLFSHNKIEDIEWLFVMQHNGVPTRLLDWTESPLVALYFACLSSDKKDGALNILLPLDLNKKAGIPNDSIISINDASLLTSYSPHGFKSTKVEMAPIAIICPRNTTRIQSQLGTFTIFHRNKASIDSLYDQNHIWRYTIPGKAKKQILKELRLLGIDEFRLFPELPSLGNLIKNSL